VREKYQERTKEEILKRDEICVTTEEKKARVAVGEKASVPQADKRKI